MAIFKSLEERASRRRRLGRRRFVYFLVTAMGGLWAWRWWRFRPEPVPQRSTPFLVSNRDFYNISIRPGFRPRLTEAEYRLLIIGPGGEIRLTLEEIWGLPRRTEFRTLACVGNRIGGTGIGNAEWTVTPLAPLLKRVCGSPEEPLWASFHGMDGFYSSVPWQAAADPDTVLAYEMNGEPLPRTHGHPLRVLIPGRYGMKQPRWLERIEVESQDPGGYWESRGWCDTCEIRMTARIDSVRFQGGTGTVRGVAFCGAAPVGAVEVTDDDGSTWETARLLEEAGFSQWSTWEYNWKPKGPGRHVLAARVSDAQGRRQVDSYAGAFPSGATGYHRVIVEAG